MTKIDLTPIETEARALRAEVEGLREQLRQAQQAQRNTRDAALEEAAAICDRRVHVATEAKALAREDEHSVKVALVACIRQAKALARARIARSGE